MNCTICGKPIILVPSAEERAKKYGGQPSTYTKLFTTHANCLIKQRNSQVLELIHKLKN